jgi:alpha-galactosidase
MTFLSDPDWPVHDLQVFWGASTMLAPDACLHWSFCEWCSVHPNRPPQQTFDPRSPDLTQTHLDYYTRMSMLNVYGFSQRLPDLPEWVRERLIYHTDIYKNHVRRFVREATLYRLTDQPKRDGSGDRWSAFQYTLPEETESLLFVFRLPGAEAVRNIRLCNLQPERIYQLVGFEGEADINMSGRDLMDTGIQIDNLPEEGSVLYHMF